MKVEFKKIRERDMDLLIIEEFVSDRGFAKLFLDKLQLSNNYCIDKVFHSLTDIDGESDITIILQYPDKKVGLLIEDKIDAPTMHEQSKRYEKRAQKGRLDGEFDVSYIMLVAPFEYHAEHKNDPNAAYQYRISYEELRDYLKRQDGVRAEFKTAVIDSALEEKKKGYIVQEDLAVTAFWSELRKYCKNNYPRLSMVGEDRARGSSSAWPEFNTAFGKIKVIYKSQKGNVDLEFPGMGDKLPLLQSAVKDFISGDMEIRKTKKSACVRLHRDEWSIDFSKDFEHYREAITEVLQAVSKLCELASKIDYSRLY